MAAENFKVKKGLEVGTGITANSDGVNVTGIITATQFKGDGSGLTGVVGSGSGVVVKDEGSAVGTAGTINFVGSGVAATLSAGTATVTVNAGGLDNVVEDTTPQLGGNLDLNSKFVTGSGGINVTGVVTATTLKGNGDFVDIDVDGHTELDNVNVVGIVTITNSSSGSGLKLFDASGKQFAAGGGGGGSPFAGSVTGHDFRIQVGGLQNAIFKYAAGATGNLELGPSSGIGITFNGASGNANYAGIITATGANITGIATFTGGVAKLHHNGQQKLITTINGIEVPDLNVTGVGTVGRLDTSGVTLGTNSTTFAAKFIDDAVANFGDSNELQIEHDTSQAEDMNVVKSASNLQLQIRTDKLRIVDTDATQDLISANVDGTTALHHSGNKKLETDQAGVKITGVCTATSFSGDGSGLTGITASGSGILVKHDGSNVGTAGTINFSTNLDVSPISAGIVTVTASSSGVSDGDKGDITVSNNGATFTIDNLAVTNAKIQGAIAGTKIDPDFGSQNIDTSGNITSPVLVAQGASGSGDGIILINSGGGQNNDFSRIRQVISDDSFVIENKASGSYQSILKGTSDRVVELHHQGTKKLETDQAGVKITGVCTATSFSGSGIGLTSLNASELDSGTIPNGRFPATLPATSGANLTALNASEITSGTLPIARITDGAVTFAKMQDVGTGVLIGRNNSGSGDMETLSASEVRTLLNVADGATAGITTAPSNIAATWSIGGNSGSGYQFTGPGQDGSEGNPDIYLVRGQKYRFVNTTGTGHPFEFRNEANNADYTDGITGSQSGTQEFNVQHDAPAALKYRCTIHTGSMLGNIYIVGQHLANGANNRVLTATSAYGMNGESNLTFDGTTLSATGQLSLAGGVVLQPGGTAWSTTNNRPQIQRQADGELRLGAGSDSSSIVTFYTSPSAGGTLVERLRIQSNGIVKVESNDSSGLSAHLLVNNSESNSGLSIMGSGSSFSSGGWAAVTDAGIIRSSANSSNGLVLQAASGDLRFYVGGNPPAERVRITSSGNVNIGTNNLSQTTYKAQIETGTNKFISFINAAHDDLSNEGSGIIFSRQNDGSKELSGIFGHSNSSLGIAARTDLTFHAGGTSNYGSAPERLRIDSGGIVKIGAGAIGNTNIKGSSGTGNEGVYLDPGGPSQFAISNASVMALNRKTSEGRVFEVRYNGSVRGYFDTNGSSLPSDKNYKTDISDLNLGLSFVNKLKPSQFRFKDSESTSPILYGLIAQDVEESLTSEGVSQNSTQMLQYKVIADDDNESDYYLDYGKLTPVLINAVKELSTEIDKLKAEIAALKSS